MTGRIYVGMDALRFLVSGDRQGPGCSSPMQEATWLGTCAEVLTDPAQLVVAASGPAENPLAMAAFVRRDGLVPRLEQLGVKELHEKSDFFHRSLDSLHDVIEAIDGIGLPLLLPRYPATSESLAVMREVLGRRIITRPASGAPFIPLAPGIDPDKRLSSSLRADLRRARRRADAHGTVEIEIASPSPEEVQPLFDEAIRIESSGWKGREGSALARDRARGWFFRLYALRSAALGRLRLAFLRISGRAAAMQLAVEAAKRYWILKIGYDEELSFCSPGQLLMHETLRWAAQRGLDSYEFLGASETWTRRWTTNEHECVSVRAYSASRSGLAALGADAARFAWGRVRSS